MPATRQEKGLAFKLKGMKPSFSFMLPQTKEIQKPSQKTEVVFYSQTTISKQIFHILKPTHLHSFPPNPSQTKFPHRKRNTQHLSLLLGSTLSSLLVLIFLSTKRSYMRSSTNFNSLTLSLYHEIPASPKANLQQQQTGGKHVYVQRKFVWQHSDCNVSHYQPLKKWKIIFQISSQI